MAWTEEDEREYQRLKQQNQSLTDQVQKFLSQPTPMGGEMGPPGLPPATPAFQDIDSEGLAELAHQAGQSIIATLDYPRAAVGGVGLGIADLAGKGLQKVGAIDQYKPLLREGEFTKAINPFDLDTLPEYAEFYKRAGVGQMGQLSNAPLIGSMYEDPSKTGKDTWRPDKGGMLDPTGRGALGLTTDIGLDPSTYPTLGAAPAFKKGLGLGLKKLTPASMMPRRTMGERISRGVQQGVEAFSEPVKSTLTSRGKAFYKQAFGKADEVAQKFDKVGTYSPSELIYQNSKEIRERMAQNEVKLQEEIRQKQARGEYDIKGTSMQADIESIPKARGGWGTSQDLADQAKAFTQLEMEKYDNIIAEASDGGAFVNTKKHFEPILKDIDELLEGAGRDFAPKEELRQIRDKVESLIKSGTVSPVDIESLITKEDGFVRAMKEPLDTATYSVKEANRIKQDVYGAMKKSDWEVINDNPQGAKILKKLASALREGMEEGVDNYYKSQGIEGMGAQLRHHGRSAGAMLTVRNPLAAEAAKEGRRKAITQVDAMAAVYNPAMFTAKQATKLGGTPFVQSGVGKLMRATGEAMPKFTDMGIRRGGFEYYSTDQPDNYVERQPQSMGRSRYAPVQDWQEVNKNR